MANTPNQQQSANFLRSPAIIKTNLGPIGGEIGEIEELDTDRLFPLRIHRAEGGVMVTEFAYRLGKVDERLVDFDFWSGYEQLAEVEMAMPSGTQDILLSWGEFLTQDLQVSPEEEFAVMTLSVTPPHYGEPLRGMHVSNHAPPSGGDPDSDPLIHYGPIIFNPEIDGKVIGNKTKAAQTVHKIYGDAGSDQMTLSLWIDPDSVRTGTARNYSQRDVESDYWTLADAVATCCQICNRDEEFIINPTIDDLSGDALEADEVRLRNLTIEAGLYLPDVLNALLKPHGYSWFLKPGRNQDSNSPDYGSTEIRIKVFKLGKGITKTVHQPRPDDREPNPDKRGLKAGGPQNCIQWKLRQSFDELRNKVMAIGAAKEREMTFLLKKGWPASYDDLSEDELAKDAANYERYRNVWRLWVLNEGGDWTSTRAEITEAVDLTEEFGDQEGIHRRQLQDCLTYHTEDDGDVSRRQPFVEWKVTPESQQETVTLRLYGDALPLSPVTATWTLHWEEDGTEHEIGPYDENALEADIETDLIAEGISTLEEVAGTLSAGIDIKFNVDADTPPIFWVEGEFDGGNYPGISVRSNAWQPIPDGWGPILLQDQVGIYFDGDRAVEDLKARAGEGDVLIRVTGTVVGDTRITSTAEKDASSPLEHEHEFCPDVSDRFFDRQLQRTGRYMSSLIGVRQTDESSGADELDSSDDIEQWADDIRKIEDSVNVVGTFTLMGISLEYEIGDLLKEIGGRKISLNRKATDSGLTQYVQVTEIDLINDKRQRTILTLTPLDQSLSRLHEAKLGRPL